MNKPRLDNMPPASVARYFMPFVETKRGGVRMRVQVMLRWATVAGQLTTILICGPIFGYPIPTAALLMIVALSAALNLWLMRDYPRLPRLNERQVAFFLAYDIIQLGGLLYLAGGLSNPFALLFLAPVTVSASVLSGRITLLLAVLAVLIASILVPFHWPLLGDAALMPDLPEIYLQGLWVALCLALLFIPAYVWRVTYEARRMASALAVAQEILEREKRLSAVDKMAAAAAHQFGTPLSTIVLIATELQNAPDMPPAVLDDLRILREQAQRCRAILSTLTDAVAQNDALIAEASLCDLIAEAAEETRVSADKRLDIRCDGDGDMPLVARRPEIIYGLGNIIENAAHYAQKRIDIVASYDAAQIRIVVCDDGAGFPSDVLAQLGEPYTTPRSARKDGRGGLHLSGAGGMGLGFFIAKTLLERIGAQIRASNAKNGGAQVEIIWARDVITP